MFLRNIPQVIWIGSTQGGQITEGEEKSAAGADLFCFREDIYPSDYGTTFQTFLSAERRYIVPSSAIEASIIGS